MSLFFKVCHLEKDCELLKEIIDMDEGIIRDLQFKVDELEGSEKNLNKVVDRLESVERVLRASESAAFEENARWVNMWWLVGDEFLNFVQNFKRDFFSFVFIRHAEEDELIIFHNNSYNI